MKIVAKFNLFKECLSQPVNEGAYDVFYEESDTMTVAEHINLNNSNAPISLIPATSIGNVMAEMIMLGNKMATEGSFIYVTENDQLLGMVQYSSGDSAVYFEKDMFSALKKIEQEERKKGGSAPARKKSRPKAKKKDEIETEVVAEAQNISEVKNVPDNEEQEEPKQEELSPKPATEIKVPQEKTADDKKSKATEEVKTKAKEKTNPEKKKVKVKVKAKDKVEKNETKEEVQTSTETEKSEPLVTKEEKKTELSTSSFKTPDSIVRELVKIDKDFGNFPDHIIAGIRDCNEADDLMYGLAFYIDPPIVQEIEAKLKPHYDKLKPMADRTKFVVNSVYKNGEFVL